LLTATPPTSTADAVQALREASPTCINGSTRVFPLSREQVGFADYALHLAVLRNWQLALSPWLVRTGSDGAGLALIDQDLADCGPVASASPPAAPVDLAAVRRVDDGSDAFCWGIAHVLEGSRLGGQVLYRRLAPRLAPHPLRYIAERPRHARPWGETLACLRRQLDSAADRQSGCAGAVAAFETLLRHFEVAGCRL
jgi:heme oxygenase